MTPEEIKLNRERDCLSVVFAGEKYELSAEYLRVCSPSAEVRGHGDSWRIFSGKKLIKIFKIKPIGNYALQIIFSDGHSSGIYSWQILYDLAINYETYWTQYLNELQRLNKYREKK